MRVVVTGGCGFIGWNLVKSLVSAGCEVVVVDNFSTSSPARREELRREELVKNVVTTIKRMRYTVDGADAIVHLGQPSSSPLYWTYPELLPTTVEEMCEVLSAAAEWSCPVVYASSSSVYATNPLPWREDMPVHPFDRYSEVKHICERLGALWAVRHKINFIALRLFSVYGEGEEYKREFANLITQLLWSGLLRRQIEIYCMGEQKRDLVYVQDAVEAILRAIELAADSKPGFWTTINVGSGECYTVKSMARIVRDYAGVEPVVRYTAKTPRFYITNTLADTRKARELLNWEARHMPENVIDRVADYYRLNVHAIAEWKPMG